jgi:DNA/RNA-binding domain of Phe-tRNA-synthetase-like protein
MGAYDMAKLPPEPMLMRFADPAHDRFTPLGGKAEDYPFNPDLVVYASGNTVLCWGFNHRDNVETALDAQSDSIVFFSEALNPEDGARSAQAVREVKDRLAGIGVRCSNAVRADRAQAGFAL